MTNLMCKVTGEYPGPCVRCGRRPLRPGGMTGRRCHDCAAFLAGRTAFWSGLLLLATLPAGPLVSWLCPDTAVWISVAYCGLSLWVTAWLLRAALLLGRDRRFQKGGP